MKPITKEILKVELVKIETAYNPKRKVFYYNLYLTEIDEPLLISKEDEIDVSQLLGMKIKYKLNEDNIITEFDLL